MRERRHLVLYSLLLLLATWACPQASASGSCEATSDPCCFSGVPHAEPGPTRLGKNSSLDELSPLKLRYASPSWMRSCLRGVRTSAHSAEHTGRLVTTMFQDSYVAAGLLVLDDVLEETDDTSVVGAASMTVKGYGVQVDVEGAIQEALNSSRLDESEHHSSFDLHYGFAEALRPLMDHNTLYETPFHDWTLHRQVTLRAHKTQDNDHEWRLHSLEAPRALTEAQYEAVHGRPLPPPQSYEGLAVSHVNGIAASEYMQQRSDALGGSRDAVGRLARLLSLDGSSSEPESLSNVPPPASDMEVFTFFGGVSETWHLTVSHRGTAETSNDLEELYGDTRAFDRFAAAVASAEAAHNGLWGGSGSGSSSVVKAGPLEGVEGDEESFLLRSTGGRFEVWADGVEEMVRGLMDLPWSSSSTGSAQDSSKNEGDEQDDENEGDEHQDDVSYGGPEEDDYEYDYYGSAYGYEEEEEERFYCDYGECDYSDESYDYDDFTDMEPRELGGDDGVVQVALLSSGLTRRGSSGGSGGFLGVYHLPQQQALVVKVNSFAPMGGFYGPRLGKDAAAAEKEEGRSLRVLEGLKAAFGAAESYARRRGVKRLLLDLSGAADEGAKGGDSAYAAALFSLRYLQPGWREASLSSPSVTARDLCDMAAFPISEFTRGLVDAAEGAEAGGLRRLVEELEGEELRAAGRAVGRAGAAAARLLLDFPGDAAPPSRQRKPAEATSALEAVLSDPIATDGAVRGAIEAFVTVEVGGVIRSMVDAALGGASKRSLGNFALLNETRSWLARSLSAEETPQFSPFYFPGACREALDAPLGPGGEGNEEVSPAFEKAVVLVDGACGAACSTIAARLALSGSAYVVSHGGDGRTVLDVSPSARGGPRRWEHHARSQSQAALLLRAFSPFDDEGGDGSSRSGADALGLLLSRLPGPLPSRADVRFAVDGTFEPYLGKHAHPRDFYRISAGNHLPLWIESPRTLPTHGESLDVVRVWKMASQFLSSSAPLLKAWKPAPSMAEEVDEEYVNPADEQPAEETVTATAISSGIIFREMVISDAAAAEDSIVGAFAAAAGISAEDIVVVDVAAVPGGVQWNVTAVFSAVTSSGSKDPAEAYVEALESDLSGMLATNDGLFRFQPELNGVVRTETQSAAAYMAAVESERGAVPAPADSSSARMHTTPVLPILSLICCLYLWCMHHSRI